MENRPTATLRSEGRRDSVSQARAVLAESAIFDFALNMQFETRSSSA